jgi:hypothetical protein
MSMNAHKKTLPRDAYSVTGPQARNHSLREPAGSATRRDIVSPVDLVATIRAELAATRDPARQEFLLCLGNVLARRRQTLTMVNKPRRRWR